MKWDDAVSCVKGIGSKTAAVLNHLGIETVGDLVTYFPRDYDSYDKIRPISSVRAGSEVVIEGTLMSRPTVSKVRNLTIINVNLKDSTGIMRLTWFNMPYIAKTLRPGTYYIMRGKAVMKNGVLVIEQPRQYSKQDYYNGLGKLLPVYRLTKGISNNNLRKYIQLALNEVEFDEDYLPAKYCRENSLYSRKKAISTIHYPKDINEAVAARKRLAFDEFFTFLLALRRLKGSVQEKPDKERYTDSGICHSFIEKLPYELTGAQAKVWNELKNDMMSGKTMARLIQGDVGSGKTILAALALLFNYDNGFQGAIMAPTEVLAKQHYELFSKILADYGITTGLLTGSMTAPARRKMYESIANGDIDIVVGTHAIIQEKVGYKKLGLVITDEQHRFGVSQRIQLSEKGSYPHTLVMSATPIPRTLAMILYGDMDISVVDELPQGRLPIQNCVVGTSYRNASYKLINKEISEGRQAYIICPMVEEDEESNLESVEGYSDKIANVFSKDIRIGTLHGRMKAKDKNDIMEAFAAGRIDILVSTTVIEVGINVPNATVMMVENSERFGLATLHQLRGRVGRGDKQSYCIFMHGDASQDSIKRLEVLGQSNDGFHIASQDLKMRGPGDMFGVRQSGDLSFVYADVYSDADVLVLANEFTSGVDVSTAAGYCEKYPYLDKMPESQDGNPGL